VKKNITIFLAPSKPVGTLVYQSEGSREACQFTYLQSWLADPERFAIDPELPLREGYQFPQKGHNVFFGCLADTGPDGWGRKLIQRDRVKRGLATPDSLDYLLDIHDASRMGAIRFSEDGGKSFLAEPADGKRAAPPLIEISQLLRAASAVEQDSESAQDLRLLLDRGSPLGGMRPKCTIQEEDGALAIGKFPSSTDEHDVVRSEILVLDLARAAGIDASQGRVVLADGKPVAVIRRFDRRGEERLAYQSARTFLGANNSEDEHSYLEFADELRANGASPRADIEELWRRIVFTILASNFDDHLNNHGFLHAGHGQWRLAPAFDVNPAPDKKRVLKTWVTPDSGPEATIAAAFSGLRHFGIKETRAREMLGDVVKALSGWRARARQIGMKPREIEAIALAFEHVESEEAKKLTVWPRR